MTDLQKTPFVKELASSDKKLRDKATDSLIHFLRSRTDLSLIELLKLWKGLFFCFYHSDRPLTQQALARNLSYTLVPTLPRTSVHRFLRAFWITISRDFHSLDRLRLDKYLFLIRCYIGVAFSVFVKGDTPKKPETKATKKRKAGKKEAGNAKKRSSKQRAADATDEDEEEGADDTTAQNGKWDALESYISIIEEGPLCPLNFDPDQPAADEKNDYVPMPHGPDGLRYHIMDIWLDELEKVLEFEAGEGDDEEETRKPKGEVPMDLLLRPIEKLRVESPTKQVRIRAKEALDDERLIEWGFKERKVESDEEEDSEQEWGGFGDD
ncbi:hypothetical protein FE257_006201 [Aspergillus nanangensis]|uniref:Ribosomal RNA processing protein n=1 Tax=Aspergillus nanangensis TaxID=2582783 RepID=A0AAD4CPX1_ASPNN|nr:hypothetical protein FE257_006201 [Aspergillus nanangensis]